MAGRKPDLESGTLELLSAASADVNATLAGALDILALIDGSGPIEAHGADEARAVEELAAKSTSFIRTNPAQVRVNRLEVDGASIVVADDRRPHLAMMLFRHRLAGGPWDLEGHRRMDEKWLADHHESLRVMNDCSQLLQEQHHAPRIETLLETPTAIYYRTDFATITFGADGTAVTPLIWNRVPDVHYTDQVSYLASIGRVNAEFQSMGYRHLGDYQHSRSDRREAYRVYGGSDDGTFALWSIVAGSFNMQWFFYSLLDDGFWVTTATLQLPDGAPRPVRSSHHAVGNAEIRR